MLCGSTQQINMPPQLPHTLQGAEPNGPDIGVGLAVVLAALHAAVPMGGGVFAEVNHFAPTVAHLQFEVVELIAVSFEHVVDAVVIGGEAVGEVNGEIELNKNRINTHTAVLVELVQHKPLLVV